MDEYTWDKICERAIENNKTIICEVDKKHSRRFFRVKCNVCGEEKEARFTAFKGCKKCSYAKNRSNTEEFILKAKIKHGDKYSYDLVEYINSYTKVKMFCNYCQIVFEQRPHGHLRGKGCAKCSFTSNTEEFILKAQNIHGDKYNYELVEYINSYTKVKIFCNTCKKIFEEEPSLHLLRRHCTLCNQNNKLNKEKFLLKSTEIHGDSYNYDLVDFISSAKKVEIKCNHCEKTFLLRPFDHLRGRGCKSCTLRNRTRSLDEFISIAKRIHGDSYNYNSVNYVNKRTKINIYCNTCKKTFLQNPSQHLKGQGCKICADNSRRLDTNSFIEKARKVHNYKYNYDLTEYVDSNIKVKIFCKECNNFFEQRPADHLQGIGCRKCAIKFISEQHRSNTEEFILKAEQKHGNKYNYDLVEYVDAFFKVKILCIKCNIFFEQVPNNHLYGSGCPKCKESKGENKVASYLEKINEDFITQKTFDYLKDIRKLKFDFYLPKHNKIIEFDGAGHFMAIWGTSDELKQKRFEDCQKRDRIKNEWAKANNIPMLRIPYWDFDRVEELIEAFILDNTKQEDKQLSLET